MDVSTISRLLWLRRTLRRRAMWTETQLRDHQLRQLAKVRGFASANSRFYRRFHLGLEGAPLGELPVLTKAKLMDNFDEQHRSERAASRSAGIPRRTTRLPELFARLNNLHPDVLVAYASMMRTLALEQLAWRLNIAPHGVGCGCRA